MADTLQMTDTPDIEAGQIVKGRVARLEDFGAFIEVPLESDRKVTGLCHVSEINDEYIENIYAHITAGDEVDVKVLDIKPDGKVDLSIKRADDDYGSAADEEHDPIPRRSKLDARFNKRLRKFMHKSQMIQGERRRQRRGRLGMG